SAAGSDAAETSLGAAATASACAVCTVVCSACAVWVGASTAATCGVRPCSTSLACPGALATTSGWVVLSSLMTTTKDCGARPGFPTSPKVISRLPGGSGASGTKAQSPLDSTSVEPMEVSLAKISTCDPGVPLPAITTEPSGSARNSPKVAAIMSSAASASTPSALPAGGVTSRTGSS